jgi:hypothetical protein
MSEMARTVLSNLHNVQPQSRTLCYPASNEDV